MTEAEWLVCSNPRVMLRFAESQTNSRKLRLLSCACVRTVWDHLRDSRSRAAVELAERVADGDGSDEEITTIREAAYQAAQGKRTWAVWAAVSTLTDHFLDGWHCDSGLIRCRLLRDLLGPICHRSVPVLPGWLSWDQATVVNLAQTIYTERAFDRAAWNR